MYFHGKISSMGDPFILSHGQAGRHGGRPYAGPDPVPAYSGLSGHVFFIDALVNAHAPHIAPPHPCIRYEGERERSVNAISRRSIHAIWTPVPAPDLIRG